jgi:hypothetical protein
MMTVLAMPSSLAEYVMTVHVQLVGMVKVSMVGRPCVVTRLRCHKKIVMAGAMINRTIVRAYVRGIGELIARKKLAKQFVNLSSQSQIHSSRAASIRTHNAWSPMPPVVRIADVPAVARRDNVIVVRILVARQRYALPWRWVMDTSVVLEVALRRQPLRAVG